MNELEIRPRRSPNFGTEVANIKIKIKINKIFLEIIKNFKGDYKR